MAEKIRFRAGVTLQRIEIADGQYHRVFEAKDQPWSPHETLPHMERAVLGQKSHTATFEFFDDEAPAESLAPDVPPTGTLSLPRQAPVTDKKK